VSIYDILHIPWEMYHAASLNPVPKYYERHESGTASNNQFLAELKVAFPTATYSVLMFYLYDEIPNYCWNLEIPKSKSYLQ
jgi:hypothetical protein